MALATSYRIADRLIQGETLVNPIAVSEQPELNKLRDTPRVDLTGLDFTEGTVNRDSSVRMPFNETWFEYEESLTTRVNQGVARSAVLAVQSSPTRIDLVSVLAAVDGRLHLSAHFIVTTEESGQFVKADMPNAWAPLLTSRAEFVGRDLRDVMQISFEEEAVPALYAAQLMNCKNVDLIDAPNPPRRYSKRTRKRDNPRLTFKTIQLPGHVRSEATRPGAGRAETAWHIVRGHFATYTEEKPR